MDLASGLVWDLVLFLLGSHEVKVSMLDFLLLVFPYLAPEASCARDLRLAGW